MRYLILLAAACSWGQIFDGSGDIGVTPKAGSMQAGPPIRLTGGGANVWGNADALFFAHGNRHGLAFDGDAQRSRGRGEARMVLFIERRKRLSVEHARKLCAEGVWHDAAYYAAQA